MGLGPEVFMTFWRNLGTDPGDDPIIFLSLRGYLIINIAILMSSMYLF